MTQDRLRLVDGALGIIGLENGYKINFDAGDLTIGGVAVEAGTAAIEIQEEDVQTVAEATVLNFDGSDFNVTDGGSGEAQIALAYGTSAGTPAEGNHTHAAPGLAYIAESAFSGSSGVNLDNCFTATYTNYRIVAHLDASTTAHITLRLRAASSDDSGTNYRWSLVRYTSGTLDSKNGAGTGTGDTSWNVIWEDSGTPINCFLVVDVFRPQLADETRYASQGGLMRSATSLSIEFNAGGQHTATTAYDGFTILPSAGTITGTVRVYGYRNS
jgi:hypothetical protein